MFATGDVWAGSTGGLFAGGSFTGRDAAFAGGVVDDETAEGDEADLASVADWALGIVLGAGAGGPGVGVGAVAAACCSGLGGGCVILNTAANCGS